MRDLADAYVAVRARDVKGIHKLDPGGKDSPGERHLLGVPLTNHGGGWGRNARHASPLRFFVRQINGKFHGFILHLPHSFSSQKKLPPGIIQTEVWKNVHRKLDGIVNMKRASYEDCL
jgi:hypothetical protein